MYGTYRGFSLPLNTLAALVASRPRVWPLASTTYHLRSILLPLGTNVDILFPTFGPALGPNRCMAFKKFFAHSAFAHAKRARARFPPTAKQFCSGEDDGAYPLRDPDSAGLDSRSGRRCLFQLSPL